MQNKSKDREYSIHSAPDGALLGISIGADEDEAVEAWGWINAPLDRAGRPDMNGFDGDRYCAQEISR